MRYALAVATLILFTGCKIEKAEPEVKEYVNYAKDITAFDYARSGWFAAPGGVRGIKVRVELDNGRQRFTLRASFDRPSGESSCPVRVFEGEAYRDLVASLYGLHQVEPPRTGLVDAGVATMTIKDSLGGSTQWVLDTSDDHAWSLPVLGGAGTFERKLTDVAGDCGPSVTALRYSRGGGYPVPNGPREVTVDVSIDVLNQRFSYVSTDVFDRGSVKCSATLDGSEYVRLMDALQSLEEVGGDPVLAGDAGLGYLALSGGYQTEEYWLEVSDVPPRALPYLSGAGPLEAQLREYARSCSVDVLNHPNAPTSQN